MKTQKIKSVKTLTTLMLVLMLLSIISCGNEQGKSSSKDDQSSISETKEKAPSMNIHAAAFLGNLEDINQHIKVGTNLNEKDEYGSTPLTIAVTFDKTDVAKALIKAKADLSITNNEGSTPLHTAAFFCRTEIVKALLANGADKSLKNNYGSTALESISVPFKDVKGIYDHITKQLGPLGLKLDYKHIEITRPIIAEMLQR